MRVKKFQAKSMPEAMSMVKSELGDSAIIIHSREKHPGIMGMFLGRGVEVTAAVDMKATAFSNPKTQPKPHLVQQLAPVVDDLPPILPVKVKDRNDTGRKFDFKVDDDSMSNDAPNPLLEMTKRIQEQSKKKKQNQNASNINKTHQSNDAKPNGIEPTQKIEQRLIHLESQLTQLTGMLENLSPSFAGGGVPSIPPKTREIYNHLLDQDVDESLALAIATRIAETTDEKDDTWTALKSHLLDKIPTAPRIDLEENPKTPKIIMLVGPTGVGKTTTLAKISAQYRYAVNNKFKPKIVFITADLYRLAAVEQLQKYTEILGVDLEVTYSPDEVKQAIKKHKDAHLILFDTAGTAQRNMPQISTLCSIVDAAQPTEVHLVLSSTTKYSDAIDIIDHFKDMKPARLIFSKIDESTTYGTLLNICVKYKIPVSYVTTGQNVPEDIELARPEKIAKLLLTKPAVNRSIKADVHHEKKDERNTANKNECNESVMDHTVNKNDESKPKMIDLPLNSSKQHQPKKDKQNKSAQG